MKSVIKIVKPEKEQSNDPSRPQENKEKKAPSEREIASTIKRWIADREQRKRLADVANRTLLTKFAQ